MAHSPWFKGNSGEKLIFVFLQFNGYANRFRKMDSFIYHTSIIVVLLDRRDIKIWYSAWGRTILANMAKENNASLATLAKNYCPDIFEAITPYKIPGRTLPNPVRPAHWSSGRNNFGNITEAWLKKNGKNGGWYEVLKKKT